MDNDIKLLEKVFGIDPNEYDDPDIWERLKTLEHEEKEDKNEKIC